MSDAENRDPWDLPQPVPRAHHTLLIEHASLVYSIDYATCMMMSEINKGQSLQI